MHPALPRKRSLPTRCLCLLGWSALGAALCLAEEGGASHYLPGTAATPVDNAPTRPGWVALGMVNLYSGAAQSSRQYPIAGRRVFNLEADAQAGVATVMYTAKPKVLGASYSAAVGIPVAAVAVEGTVSGPLGTLRRRDSVIGLGDISLVPAYLAWTNGAFQFNGLLRVYAPSGDYEVGRLANTGLNYWTVNPSVGISYSHPKLGFGGTVFSGVTVNTENEATDYRSGSAVFVDGSLHQFLPLFDWGYVGIGANAFYYQQVSADSGSGVRLGDFEGRTVGVGPLLTWLYETRGGSTLVAEVKWLPELETKRRLKGDSVWFKFAVLF